MKDNLLPSFLLVCCCCALPACTSTETGNPAQPDSGGDGPVTGAPPVSAPVTIDIGLRSTAIGLPASLDGAHVTDVWLRISEVEFLTCAGGSLWTSELSATSSLGDAERVTVAAPDEEVCAIVVRSEPLENADASLPVEGVGQGALVRGTTEEGGTYSAAIPSRITAVLAPISDGLLLSAATNLRLTIDDTALTAVDETSTQDPAGMNSYNSETAPALVHSLGVQLSQAFSLVSGTAPNLELLAQSVMVWTEVEDLLCTSDCKLSDRAGCSDTECAPTTCVAALQDQSCGQPYRSLLYCRIGLHPEEVSCAGAPTPEPACSEQLLGYQACMEGR